MSPTSPGSGAFQGVAARPFAGVLVASADPQPLRSTAPVRPFAPGVTERTPARFMESWSVATYHSGLEDLLEGAPAASGASAVVDPVPASPASSIPSAPDPDFAGRTWDGEWTVRVVDVLESLVRRVRAGDIRPLVGMSADMSDLEVLSALVETMSGDRR